MWLSVSFWLWSVFYIKRKVCLTNVLTLISCYNYLNYVLEATIRDKIFSSATDDAHVVANDATREEISLQSISLEHNRAYGKVTQNIIQQTVPVIYDIPLLLPQHQEEEQEQQQQQQKQHQQEYSNNLYEEINDCEKKWLHNYVYLLCINKNSRIKCIIIVVIFSVKL